MRYLFASALLFITTASFCGDSFNSLELSRRVQQGVSRGEPTVITAAALDGKILNGTILDYNLKAKTITIKFNSFDSLTENLKKGTDLKVVFGLKK